MPIGSRGPYRACYPIRSTNISFKIGQRHKPGQPNGIRVTHYGKLMKGRLLEGTPLVDGSPPARGFGSVTIRSARALDPVHCEALTLVKRAGALVGHEMFDMQPLSVSRQLSDDDIEQPQAQPAATMSRVDVELVDDVVGPLWPRCPTPTTCPSTSATPSTPSPTQQASHPVRLHDLHHGAATLMLAAGAAASHVECCG